MEPEDLINRTGIVGVCGLQDSDGSVESGSEGISLVIPAYVSHGNIRYTVTEICDGNSASDGAFVGTKVSSLSFEEGSKQRKP